MAETSILALIAAHQGALAANDAAHEAHENRKPGITSEELAPILAASDTCFDAERAAWNALASASCNSAAEVQAKLSYILESERLSEWIETGIEDPLGFLRSLRLPTPPADPLLALIEAYRTNYEAALASLDEDLAAGRVDENAQKWRPLWDHLRTNPPAATSLAGVQAALQLIHDENDDESYSASTRSVAAAALAYFGRV